VGTIRIDATVFLFALGLTFFTTLLFGLLPALRLSRIDLLDALKQGTSRTGVGGNRRVRQALMVAEIALALMLSVGAGLLLRSFHRLTSVNLGFRTDNLVTMRVFVQDNVDAPPVRARYLENLVSAVRGLGIVLCVGRRAPEKRRRCTKRSVPGREFSLFRRHANADSRGTRFR
jgi:putative ABC transport system permease protein